MENMKYVTMRKRKNIQAKDKVYAPRILLNRLKFRFDILKLRK